MPNIKICVDTPTSHPRSIAFHIAGWVAADSPIKKICAGSQALSWHKRADVEAHFEGKGFSEISGFYGIANELEVEGGEVTINVFFADGSQHSQGFSLSANGLLEVSKARNFDNFKQAVADVDPASCVAKSFELALPNERSWRQKGIHEVIDPERVPGLVLDDAAAINCLPPELAKKFNITENGTAASRGHDPLALALIGHFADGLILDCGSGLPLVNYANVVNFEIQPYANTDVLGVGQALPFKDASFDAVFSHSVLEHVTDPFLCAREIERVLKPGGIIYASVPFLIPLHGYPDHYYNMTQNGLRNLFNKESFAEIVVNVPNSGHPMYAAASILDIWRNGLAGEADKAVLESLTVKELIEQRDTLVLEDFAQHLPQAAQSTISCTNVLVARKE